MSGYDGRGARFPLTIVRGADMAFELVVTDSVGAAVNVSAATIAGELYTTAGTLVDTMTAVVSGAGNNVVTLSFTDTETALFTSKQYQWSLTVTRGGDKRPWLAGRVNVTDGTSGGTPTSGTQTLTVDSDLTVNVAVGAIGYDVDAAALLTAIKTVDGAGSGLDADLLDGQSSAFYAPIASPTLTGTPAAPTAATATDTTQIATTAYVKANRTEQAAADAAQYAPLASAVSTVTHGPLHDYPRPTWAGPMFWLGSVEPDNAVAGDVWLSSTADWVSAYDPDLLGLTGGDPVNSWPDVVAGFDATDTGAPPTFVAASGGTPAHVNSVSDSLQTAAYALSQPFTMILVFRPTTNMTSSGSRILIDSDNGADSVGFRQRYTTLDTWQVQSGASPQTLLNLDRPVAGQWMIALLEFNGTSSIARINGENQARSLTNVSLVDVITIGGTGVDGDFGWFGISTLDIAGLAAVEEHLADRFGITLHS